MSSSMEKEGRNVSPTTEDARHESEVIDVEKEKALVRKIDWHLIPIIMVLYLFSFLDRGQLPVAKIVIIANHWQ
jgi:hypothetical protein